MTKQVNLSEESLEEIMIAIIKAKTESELHIHFVVRPTVMFFSEEQLRKYFGWTDADFELCPWARKDA